MAGYYAQWTRDELAARPVDRALLAGFAELVQEADVGPILNQAGFVVQAQVLREPDGGGGRFPEKTQQCFVLAFKPRGDA